MHRQTFFVLMLTVAAGTALAWPRAAHAQICTVHPTARLYTADHQLGSSMDLSGNTLLTGVPYDDDAGENSGSVFVYRESGASWTQAQEIVPEGVTAFAVFGTSVAIDENELIIGAPGDSQFSPYEGSAHVYRFNGEQWIREQTLHLPFSYPGHLGGAVAVAREWAFASAPSFVGTNGGGKVLVFRYAGGAWERTQTLSVTPPGVLGPAYGDCLAVWRDYLFVGCRAFNPGGAVDVYYRTGLTWNRTQRLLSPASGGSFGWSIAVDEGVLVVGAPGTQDAHLYRLDGQEWVYLQPVTNEGQGIGSSFGISVAIAGGEVLVGAPNDDHSEVFLFRRSPTGTIGWKLAHRMVQRTPNEGDDMGRTVASTGVTILAGAPFGDGAIYLIPTGEPGCNANGINDQCEPPDCNGNRVPDSCEIAAGTSGDCDGNGVPDECQAPINYVLDDGSVDLVWGLTGPGDFLWLNQFTVAPGAEVVTYVEMAWTLYTWKRLPVTVLLYRDPDNDGNPDDAVLLRAVDIEAHISALDAFANFQRFPVPPTHVGFPGDKFFIGALVHAPYLEMGYASSDETPPIQQRSWLKIRPLNGTDIHNLSIGNLPVLVQRNWMVRAISHDCNGDGVWNGCEILAGQPDLNGNGIPDPCEIACPPDLSPNGVVDVADLTLLLAQWNATGGPADLNHDGTVNIDDLLLLLGAWGHVLERAAEPTAPAVAMSARRDGFAYVDALTNDNGASHHRDQRQLRQPNYRHHH